MATVKGFAMNMPKVTRCDATECSYNMQNVCHALAITVGDETHPRCDTFMSVGKKGGDMGATAKVGACKVANCRYNQSFECTASGIQVGPEADEADCLTFEPM
jgi:hypothetical protein